MFQGEPLCDNTAFPALDFGKIAIALPGSPISARLAIPGELEVTAVCVTTDRVNKHFVNSMAKMIAAGLAQFLADSGYSVRDASRTWLGDHLGDGPTVIFAIHVDDLVDETYVRAAIARNIPVIAVLSPDPG